MAWTIRAHVVARPVIDGHAVHGYPFDSPSPGIPAPRTIPGGGGAGE